MSNYAAFRNPDQRTEELSLDCKPYFERKKERKIL